jgi:hypothetical protein
MHIQPIGVLDAVEILPSIELPKKVVGALTPTTR